MKRTGIVLILFSVSLFLSVCSEAGAQADCPSCHYRQGAGGFIDKAQYEGSVHGKLSCTSCHLDITRYPHGGTPSVNCTICHFTGDRSAPKVREFQFSVHGRALREGRAGVPTCQTCHGSHDIYHSLDARSRTARSKIPSLCGRCHAGELEQYDRSIHGRALREGRTDAATCFDCHMEHLVPNVKQEEWQLSLIRQCGGCHKEEMESYRKTFHGKVTRLGYAAMAKCADCHGSHEILPPGEKASTLSTERRVKTCGKCHPGASSRFTGFYAHAEETNKAKYPLLYYTYRFMTALLIGVFTFFFLHTFLWAYRSLKDLRKGREEKQ